VWKDRLGEFVTLFLVINPFEVVAAYLAMIGHLRSSGPKIRLAFNAVIFGFAVLVFFLFAGRVLLDQLHVPLRAFQIAGGLVLFLVALEMVRGEEHAPVKKPGSHLALAIYPLAVPKIAGPAAMLAVILISDDDRYNVMGQLGTVAVLGALMVLQFLLLLAAVPLSYVIGRSGSGVIGRIMGMLLAALAVSTVLGALAEWLNLPKL
jgi:multiple antibiotic resistance protein